MEIETVEILPIRPQDVRAIIQKGLSSLIKHIDQRLSDFEYLQNHYRRTSEGSIFYVIFDKPTPNNFVPEEVWVLLADHYLHYGWPRVTYTTVQTDGSGVFDRMQFSFHMSKSHD